MNKKEIAEIRRHFTPNNCTATKIWGCYVDHEKNKKFETKEAFLSLPEEEEFKYFDIFKRTLGGTLGKNLLNLEFPLAQEMEGGTQEFLYRLRNTGLDNEDLVHEFFDKIIENFDYAENYYITLTHSVYDVPGKTSDSLDLDDASEEVYTYLLCSICPVKMSKACLSYNAETNCMEDHIRDWLVEMPITGFLFPAFNDRNMDIHNLLYYSKKSDELDAVITEEVLGCQLPLPAKSQKETFNNILEESLGLDCDYEVVKTIHENLNQMLAETSEEPEPLALAKEDMSHLLMKSGVEEKEIETFETRFDETVGEDQCLMAANISSPKKFEVATPDVKVTVNPQRTDLVETKIIDGVPYLMIEINDLVEVNGIQVVSELASSGSSENSGETAAE